MFYHSLLLFESIYTLYCIVCDIADNNLKIQCDGCKKYLHANCKSVDADEAKRLTRQRARGVRFFCDDCEMKVDQFADIKSILTSISDRLEKLEACSSNASTLNFNFEDAVREAKERVQRENNVIAFGLSETPDDRSNACSLLNALSPGGDLPGNMVHVARLGKDTNRKPRPLRIAFNNPYSASDAFRLRNKLNSSPLYKNVFLRRDQTVHQMNLFKDCQSRVKQLRGSGVKNVRIKYTRGVPEVVTVGSDLVETEDGAGVADLASGISNSSQKNM